MVAVAVASRRPGGLGDGRERRPLSRSGAGRGNDGDAAARSGPADVQAQEDAGVGAYNAHGMNYPRQS